MFLADLLKSPNYYSIDSKEGWLMLRRVSMTLLTDTEKVFIHR